MFLTSSYDLTLDGKNRLSVPAAVRNRLTEDTGRNFYLLPGDRPNNLFLYAERFFERMRRDIPPTERLSKEAREWQRFEASFTALLEPDVQGRIVVPDRLLKLAGIDRDATLVCATDHLELWSRADFEAYCRDMRSNYEERRERAMSELYGHGRPAVSP